MADNPYNTPALVAQYLLFHYGAPDEQLPYADGPCPALNFPARCVTECVQHVLLPPGARALDLGCAVGRASFELARHAREVVAIDLSAAFIDAAQTMQRAGRMCCRIAVEGRQTHEVELFVPVELPRDRVHFQVGDALNLPTGLGSFDLVLAANLLDRVPDPAFLLASFSTRTRPGGQLILISPYTWLEDYTPRKKWPACGTFEFIQKNLSPHFQLLARKNLPFLIREHVRKFQWSVAEATVWQRTA